MQSTLRKLSDGRLFLIAGMGAASLYLPLLAAPNDLNAIAAAAAVEHGGGALLTPNHLLFRLLGSALFRTAQGAGLAQRSYTLLQVLTACGGILTIAFVAIAFRRSTGALFAAALASAFLATSWAQWTFSTDAHYITVATASVGAALFLLARPRRSRLNAVAAGGCVAIAILAWQASVFAIPPLLLMLARRDARRTGELWRDALAAALTVVLCVGLAYFAAARAAGIGNTAEFLAWISSHGGDRGGRLPMWGKWELARLGDTAHSALSSLIPVWQGLGLRDLLRGIPRPEKILPQMSLIALATLLAMTLALVPRAFADRQRRGLLLVPMLGYLSFFPFIVWWEPFAPKWFVVPNLFLAAALAVVWAGERHYGRRFGAASCVAIIAAANLSAALCPAHRRPSKFFDVAACVSEAVDGEDLVVLTDWTWHGYATYFHGIRAAALNLVSGQAKGPKLAKLGSALREVERRGGRVFVVDPRELDDAAQRFTETLTGLAFSDFAEFSLHPAFRCGDLSFARLSALPPPTPVHGASAAAPEWGDAEFL